MSELVLGLIPDYGLYVVFGVVVLACLAAPLPASMLVLAAGGFAATGDLVLTHVFATTFAAFVIGDQVAFQLARGAGARLLTRLEQRPKLAALLARSEDLLARRGQTAVLLSHTLLSPTCPYVSYLCGAGGMAWRPFSMAALPGAAIWTGGYVGLGYLFAGQISQVSNILSNALGLILAATVLGVSGLWLLRQWRRSRA